MKKYVLRGLTIGVLFLFVGCQQVKENIDNMVHPNHEKIDTARGVLDEVLAYIGEKDPELSFHDGQLVDAQLGVVCYEVVSVLENPHFEAEKLIDGYLVRPIVETENPNLILVVEAAGKKASMNVNDALKKVRADQHAQFRNANLLKKYTVDKNQIVRQGNFLIYATWEGSEEIVKVFERHVR